MSSISAIECSENTISSQDLWNKLLDYFQRWIGLRDSRNYHILAAFTLASYKQEIFDHAVYLQFLGKKNTGKSRSIKVLQQVCKNAFRSVDDSPAGIYRTIQDSYPCTLLIDEFSTYSKDERKEILRILNSGNEEGVTVTRINKDAKDSDKKKENFSTFCFKAFAGIDEMADTLSSRSYKIITSRMSKRYRARRKEIEAEGQEVKQLIEKWLTQSAKNEPFFSDTLFDNDRVYDLFVPLLTVAPNEDITKILVDLGSEMVDQEDEDEQETGDNLVLEAIQDIAREEKLKEGERIAISKITSQLNEERYNSWVVGRIVRRLGFKRVRSSKQSFMIFDSSVISVISLDDSKKEDYALSSCSNTVEQITQTT